MRPRTLDLFCGAGGSSSGAEEAGAQIIAGIDRCPIATQTFKANFPDARIETNLLEEIDIHALKKEIGPIDLLLASPECTNHTCAKGGAPRSEKSRATAMHVVKYARAFKPRWLVLENVVYMRPWSRFDELKRKLEEIGYCLQEHILDSSDYGVAQRRRRLFLVGDREQQPIRAVPKRRGRKKAVQSVLDSAGAWPTSPLFAPKRADATLKRAERGFQALGNNADFLLVYYGNDGSGGWQPLDRPLRTITTVDRFALVRHDGQEARIRMLQVPELRRAMGLTENFYFPVGSRRDQVRLLGNGVCPPVMQAVVESLTTAALKIT